MTNNPLGASWVVRLSGLVGGLAIALWPIIKSAMDTQMAGVQINWESIITGAAVAVVGYLAKAHDVSNSPTPLVTAQTVVPVNHPTATVQVAPVPLAQPVPIAPK